MVKDALIEQKRELEARISETYVERTVSIEKSALEGPLIKVIAGPRRAGKSFFATHLIRGLGKASYVNFDDERIADENPDSVLAAVNLIYDNPTLLFFDEVQNLAKWELFVNRLQRQRYNLILTGSNSNLLSQELATHLTGRHTLIYVMPFSFNEYLLVEKKKLTEAEKIAAFGEYVIYGGYPEPLIKHLNHRDYLSTLFNSIVFKDIVRRYKIRFAQGIDDLSIYLLSNISKEFSFNTLARVTRCKSAHTVQKYLSYLEEAFLFFTVSRFSYKLKEQIGTNKKIYCVDNGFIHAKAFDTGRGIGRLYENIVAIELKKQERSGSISFYFWKNQQQEEVDFVVKEGSGISCLIQVCYDLTNQETKKREIRSLLKAGKELNCSNLLVITSAYEAKENVEWYGMKGEVEFVPLWKWLLKK